jgi:hypothetical protein
MPYWTSKLTPSLTAWTALRPSEQNRGPIHTYTM